MGYELVITRPDRKPERVPLRVDETLVGRSHSNTLCFPDDASLSRKHLRIVLEGGDVFAEDMGSKNGTLLNNERLASRRPMGPGDRLSLGQLTLTLVNEGQEPDSAIVFDAGTPMPPDGTVMTSLEGLLSEQTGPIVREGGQIAAPAAEAAGVDPQGFRAMLRASRELVGHRPLDELFPLILDLSIEAVGAERGLLMVLEGERLVQKAMHGDGFRISSTVRDKVLIDKASVLVQDIENSEAFAKQQSISAQSIQTMMAVPLQTESRVIGLLYVDSRLLVREFGENDLNLLTILANIAATRIEQERLAALERESRQAAEIQRRILPACAPDIPGIDVAGFNAPCQTVGGDYFDYIPYDDGKIGLIVGDVAGKGVSAALLMTNLQAFVQVYAEQCTSPADLVARLDKKISGNTPSNRFITFFFGILDPGTGELTYANAGHNPPILLRKDGSQESLETTGTVLGMLPELSYTEATAQVNRGDLLAIFSDGVTEATDGDDVEFGEDRLSEILREHRQESAERVVDVTVERLKSWSGNAPDDDITLVVARRES